MIAPKAEDVQYNTMKSRIESWRGVYADWQIIDSSTWLKMIEPFEPKQVKEVNGQRVISYGLSSFGYDMRVSNEFKIFSASTGQLTVIDPKAIEEKALVDYVGDYCIIPPNSFALARSVEYFRMPANVTGIVLGKSTYARCGIVTNFTPLESGWEGFVTIEISNTTPVPVKVYANEGVAQCLFFGGEFPLVTYADRKGKYQNQVGITLARV